MLNLFLISVICVIVIDVSGFVDSLKSGIKRILTKGVLSDPNYSLKPIDCSFCMNFWVGLIYLLVSGTFTIWMLTYVLLLSVMTPVMRDVIYRVRDTMSKILKYLNI